MCWQSRVRGACGALPNFTSNHAVEVLEGLLEEMGGTTVTAVKSVGVRAPLFYAPQSKHIAHRA